MKHKNLLICSCILFFLVISSSFANQTGIVVTGAATEKVVPDMALFSFAISGRGKELAALKNQIDKNTADTVALCKKLGVNTKAISSSEISIRPQYNYRTNSFIGYEVSRQIKVELHDLSKYTDLVNGAIKSGITTINSISLDIKNRISLEQKALVAAVADARQKALMIAKSAGVSLGELLYVKEAAGQTRFETYGFRDSRAASGLVKGVFEPGEISVSGKVLVRYAVIPSK